jgi:heat shock protein HslJ
MDTNSSDMNSDDFNFDDTNSKDTNPDNKNSNGNNSNRAIMIVVMVGILLCILLVGKEQTPGSSPAVTPTTMPPAQGQTSVPPAVSTTVPATVPAVPASPIQGINWQWVSVTDQSTSQTSTVPTPTQYTIAFNTDGTVNGIADCNSFTGTYSQANGLAITITAMTMAACPEGSLDQQYLQLLGSVAAGGPDGSGNLALETVGGAQRMLFQNGGPAK